MAIVCPYCQHGMSLKEAKPGRYKPKCAKCGQRFALTVFPQPDKPPLAEQLPPEEAGATLAPATSATPAKPAAKSSSTATKIDIPADVNATTLPTTAPTAATATKAIPAPAENVESTLAFSPMSEATLAPAGADATLAHVPSGADATVAHDPYATASPDAGGATAFATKSQATTVDRGGAAARPAGVPEKIGGYKIVKELGRGAMGAVYLAKQLSLDRDVALKTIQAQWARNPAFVARFTREAYAAAQLTHHNVVQIYDLGTDADTNYFSMEFVRGESLDDLIKQQGKLDAEVAVGYVLQAARGLQFAHNHGMVHRDVKPANMMLNEHGVVKVADLGLVKVPSAGESDREPLDAASPLSGSGSGSLAAARADVTNLNVAMGTPAYMAPEQSENAAGVDHRADIYSLGCTLYVLLTGKPPFEGATAMEVITKHRTEPVVRPDAIVKRVPKDLADITLKMVTKRPEDRYQNLADVIRDLEKYLGVQSSGTFSPTDEHAQTLDECVSQFNGASLAKLRGLLPLAFFAGCAGLFVLLLFFSWMWAGGVFGLALMTTGIYFFVSGLKERTFLFDKVRELVFSARWTDWLTWAGGGLVFLLALWLIGWLWIWIGAALLAAGLGLGFYFVIDRRLAAQRAEPVAKIEKLLKSLRMRGLEETAVRQFVAKYSGENSEEFFETLFGYEAKLAAREARRGDKGRPRKKFRSWREPLLRWIDGRLKAEREEKDRRHLQKVEQQNLQAQGLDAAQAKKQAEQMADAMLDDAAEVRVAAKTASATVIDPAAAAAKKREKVKAMLAAAKSGAYQSKRRRFASTALAPVAFLFGGKVRFLLGCLLVAGCALWAKQNGLMTLEKILQTWRGGASEPLNLPIASLIFTSFNAGVAGIVLLFLGLFRGWKMSFFALPAAAAILIGPMFISSIATLATGLAIAVIGVFFGRTLD